MCACVCVCVYERVCFRHSALAATAYGRVRPAQRLARASQAEDCTAPGARQARRQPESETLLPPAGRAAPPRLRLHAARTRPPTTAKKKVQLRGLPHSYPCPGGRQRQTEEPSGSALEGPLAAGIPLPASQKFSGRGGSLSRRGPSDRRIPSRGRKGGGAHLGAAHPDGSGPHAWVGGRGGSQRGCGRPERGPRAMPSGRAALRECGAAGPGRRRRRCCCLRCRLAED